MNGETVKLGIPGAAQRMEVSAKMMIPLQRVGTPEDAAGAMLMLASPYASYITAQVTPALMPVKNFACLSEVCTVVHAALTIETLISLHNANIIDQNGLTPCCSDSSPLKCLA